MSGVVVHPARQPQLPHGGVHQGVPCPPPLPGLQVMAVAAPPQSLQTPPDGENFVNDGFEVFYKRRFHLVRRSEGLPGERREQGQLPVSQIPPGQFTLELGRSTAGPFGIPQQPARAELTEVQVGRQAAGVRSVGPAGLLVVSVHACGRSHAEAQLSSCSAFRRLLCRRWGENGAVISRLTVAEEGLQPSVRSFFAEIPGFPNVGSPVDLRRNQRRSWNAEE